LEKFLVIQINEQVKQLNIPIDFHYLPCVIGSIENKQRSSDVGNQILREEALERKLKKISLLNCNKEKAKILMCISSILGCLLWKEQRTH
jgi:hypothetical protein